jgi:hypothetical protein
MLLNESGFDYANKVYSDIKKRLDTKAFPLSNAIVMNTENTQTVTGEGKALRSPVLLSSGRLVRHERMSNGATHAFIAETLTCEMTESEWSEYCSMIQQKLI